MQLTLDKRFTKKLKGRVEDYEFEVGILNNKRHRTAMSYDLHGDSAHGSYAGGKVRKVQRADYDTDLNSLSKFWRGKVNYLVAPFESKKNKEIVEFIQEFWNVVTGRTKAKRLTNLLQAVVRNPILRQDYGKNSFHSLDRKGFNRYMIDTAQFFKNIKARVIYRGRHV